MRINIESRECSFYNSTSHCLVLSCFNSIPATHCKRAQGLQPFHNILMMQHPNPKVSGACESCRILRFAHVNKSPVQQIVTAMWRPIVCRTVVWQLSCRNITCLLVWFDGAVWCFHEGAIKGLWGAEAPQVCRRAAT